MKKDLKELREELSSAKLIIKLLQSENNLTESVRYNTIEPQRSYVNANKTKVFKWTEVVAGHHRRTKRIATNKVLDKKQVETDNRYYVLRNIQEANRIVGDLKLNTTRGVAKTNVRTQKMKKHKAILIGDSHARGCTEKLSSYLGNTYEVIGYVSPNTGLEVITDSAKEEIEQLTQNDIVIVCGGTNNISKNESNKGLRHVTQFVQNKGNKCNCNECPT